MFLKFLKDLKSLSQVYDSNFTNLIYTEEYTKYTTGMASVCIEHLESQKDSMLIVNGGHWLNEEFIKIKNAKKSFKRLGIIGLGSLLLDKKISGTNHKYITLSYKIFRRILNLFTSPLDLIFSFIKLLFIKKSVRWFIHIGGWPAGSRARILILFLVILQFKSINLIIHNQPINKRFLSKAFLWSLFIRKYVRNVITVSNYTKNLLRFYFPKVLVINNGIRDLNESRVISNLPYTINSDTKMKLLVISSLSPLKNAGQAYIELIKESKFFEITWAGPIDIQYKNRMLSNSNRNDFIKFLGYVKDINQLIIDNDIVIIPSRNFESFSMVFLESSMNKRPCICYDCIATSELILNNRTGWIIKDKPGALQDKLKEISILSKDKLLEISNNCREDYVNKFTSEKMINQFNSL